MNDTININEAISAVMGAFLWYEANYGMKDKALCILEQNIIDSLNALSVSNSEDNGGDIMT